MLISVQLFSMALANVFSPACHPPSLCLPPTPSSDQTRAQLKANRPSSGRVTHERHRDAGFQSSKARIHAVTHADITTHTLNPSKHSSTLALPAAPGALLLACVCGGLHAGSMALNARFPPFRCPLALFWLRRKKKNKGEKKASRSLCVFFSLFFFFFNFPCTGCWARSLAVSLAHPTTRHEWCRGDGCERR